MVWRWRFARHALRAGEIQDRLALAAQRHALIGRRQKSARPIHRAAARTARAGLQHDEAGQILRFAADAVGHPRTHARPAELRRAGVHEQFRGRVIENIRRAGMNDRDVVHDARGVRKQFRNPRAALAVLSEFSLRAEQLRRILGKRIHEGEPFAFQ